MPISRNTKVRGFPKTIVCGPMFEYELIGPFISLSSTSTYIIQQKSSMIQVSELHGKARFVIFLNQKNGTDLECGNLLGYFGEDKKHHFQVAKILFLRLKTKQRRAKVLHSFN